MKFWLPPQRLLLCYPLQLLTLCSTSTTTIVTTSEQLLLLLLVKRVQMLILTSSKSSSLCLSTSSSSTSSSMPNPPLMLLKKHFNVLPATIRIGQMVTKTTLPESSPRQEECLQAGCFWLLFISLESNPYSDSSVASEKLKIMICFLFCWKLVLKANIPFLTLLFSLPLCDVFVAIKNAGQCISNVYDYSFLCSGLQAALDGTLAK
ncbi:hypothetical protein FF38_12451 [Lucilia cuprina]|uniref:Uncharacterized protein n=1 Tax=Lucilia cuprina TaxID=7375 RepID=A0A0L0CIU3_LUCCU|nr:hypothetical protein FF38_12451 [Lucilia cuprina]